MYTDESIMSHLSLSFIEFLFISTFVKAQEEIGRRKSKMKEHETSYKEQTDKLNELTQKYTALDRQFKEKVSC